MEKLIVQRSVQRRIFYSLVNSLYEDLRNNPRGVRELAMEELLESIKTGFFKPEELQVAVSAVKDGYLRLCKLREAVYIGCKITVEKMQRLVGELRDPNMLAVQQAQALKERYNRVISRYEMGRPLRMYFPECNIPKRGGVFAINIPVKER